MTAEEAEDLGQTLAVTIAPELALAVYQGRAEKVACILTPLDRQQLLALAVVLASQVPKPHTRADDGVVDEVAIERVIEGEDRPLTRAERAEAVRVMAEAGGTPSTIAKHLRMSGKRVNDLLRQGAL